MRVFFSLFVFKSLLSPNVKKGTQLMSHEKVRFHSSLTPQELSSITSLDHSEYSSRPNSEDLLSIRNNCHNLEELELYFKYFDVAHYPICVDIVKANPNLTVLTSPSNHEMIDWLTKNPLKLEYLFLYNQRERITLGQTAKLLSAVPSLTYFRAYDDITLDLKQHKVLFSGWGIADVSCEDIKAFVDAVKNRITKWDFNHVTDAFVNAIVNDKETAACLTNFIISYGGNKELTLSSLKKLFTHLPKLQDLCIQHSSLTTKQFDKLFALIPESLEDLFVGGANLTLSNVMKLLKNSKNLKYIIVECEEHYEEDSEALESLKTAVKEHPTLVHFVIRKSEMPDNNHWLHMTKDSRYNWK